jgi:glycosyltransferase involved in cell wall biosynthesis
VNEGTLQQRTTAPAPPVVRSRIFFFANGVYTEHIAGGDIHFVELAKAALDSGHSLTFVGASPLRRWAESLSGRPEVILTDNAVLPDNVEQSLAGQLRLFHHYALRFLRSLRLRNQIRPADCAYAVADTWYDGVPVAYSRASRKMLILHMEAPTLGEIIRKSRADVDRFRLASLHYWLSQRIALAAIRRCRHKRVLYVNPAMREKLLSVGFRASEISHISFGLDTEAADQVPELPKVYDAAWIGRAHRQKGIADLLHTLNLLSHQVPDFKAVLIGRGAEALRSEISHLNLQGNVTFFGSVSETEKYRLLRTSRVFLMPSRYEGAPRTIGEAIASNVPVVAYDVPTYRPVFGDLLQYVPCFDSEAFCKTARTAILRERAGQHALDVEAVDNFKKENSWKATHATFLRALNDLTEQSQSAIHSR